MPVIGPNIAWHKGKALASVRDHVGTARRAYITDLPGQDAIYQAKEVEAKAYIDDPSPDMADYPMLDAETGITAATSTELANLWITMGTQWRSIAAQIEAARMTANSAIGNAATVADIEAALTALDTTLAGLPPP
jgi:hypothetical protein